MVQLILFRSDTIGVKEETNLQEILGADMREKSNSQENSQAPSIADDDIDVILDDAISGVSTPSPALPKNRRSSGKESRKRAGACGEFEQKMLEGIQVHLKHMF
jgi:hypothetical protein